MIKKVKLFINNNEESKKCGIQVKERFLENGFCIVSDDDFDLGIAVGGDGAFLRMIHQSNFDTKPYYVGINTGHLGFLQEVKISELDKLIREIIDNRYMVDEVGILETTVCDKGEYYQFKSLNEIVLRNRKLDLLRTHLYINDDHLELFTGDGLLLSTSIGSTAYNLSYGGSIVYPSFSTLQITPMAPINSKIYKSLTNSVIIPSRMVVKLVPINKDVIVTVDGKNNNFNHIESISCSIRDKKIKCLRFSHYNFPQKINEKFLS